MMLRFAVHFLFTVYVLLFSAAAVVAAPDETFLAQMKVVREIDLGATFEYEVNSLNRGRAIFKNPPFRLKPGEAVNIFVREGAPENGKPAYIALTGGNPRSFHEGFAAVNFGGGWNFVDKYGGVIRQGGFERVRDFQNGFALCQNGIDTMFLGKDGNILGTPVISIANFSNLTFDELRTGFSEGRALMLARTESGKEVPVMLDETGAVVKRITCFSRMSCVVMLPFSEGLAAMHGDSKFGFIDKSGKLIIPALYASARSFSNGLAAVGIAEGQSIWVSKWGFIDKNGKFVAAAKYDWVEDFAEERAAVKTGGSWGFIDTKGNIIVNAVYSEVLPFSDGLAAVKHGGKWGYIDRNGQVVVKFQFSGAGSFVNGLAPVKTSVKPQASWNELWGYIDKTGNLKIKPQYESAKPYSDGLALVSELAPGSGYKWKFINARGQAALWFYSYR